MKINETSSESIFKKYYRNENFFDRFSVDSTDAVDVIIPVMHTNELWKSNLLSFYREIPVHRLLLGDGGCIDNTLEITKQFPRVAIYDHHKFTSLGYSIKKLIEQVKTDWFVYLHSDVYLPKGWFEEMKKNKGKYDWFECRQHMTVLVDYQIDYKNYNRPLSGSQMGRTKAFDKVLPIINDDYLYRNEDIIYENLIKKNGFKYGRVNKTFHYHQIMNKKSKWRRYIKNVTLEINKGKDEEIREFTMQVKGIIKYTKPDSYLIKSVQQSIDKLIELKELPWDEFRQWVGAINPIWLPYIKKNSFKNRMKKKLYLHFTTPFSDKRYLN